MLAKWRVYLSGAAMDLKNVTAQQAIMMAEFQAGLTAAGESALLVGTSISGMSTVANTLKKVNDDQAAAAKKGKSQNMGEELLIMNY
jgi:ABC-type microcin C transport system duplicated ATPase subunit YejF